MNLAPIALFVYNRPNLAKQTLESLMQNELVAQSELFIFSDGAKNTSDEMEVSEVRKIIREKNKCQKTTIIESEKNKGLANSIIEGVAQLVNQYEKIIVLEDDMLTSKYFLRFMNEALEFYKDTDEVISIHGYTYPVKKELPETFFLKGADCWGWATWKRGWDLFEQDGKKLLNEIQSKNLENKFDFNGSYPYLKMLKKQVAGKNDSWAIRWNASAFLKNKLTLYPGKSLIKNIGTEGKGTHVLKTKRFDTQVADVPIAVKKIPLKRNEMAFEAVRRYFISIQSNFFQNLLFKFKRIF